MGVLERALSKRTFGTGERGTDEAFDRNSFDNKKVLPHVRGKDLHEHVTQSSPDALAGLLEHTKEVCICASKTLPQEAG